jgi:hypothetical protein
MRTHLHRWSAGVFCAAAWLSAAALPPDERCPAGNLVDAGFRDAALTALGRLWVQAPGLAADGAVRVHHSAGHVDPEGRLWHQVSAYPANLALAGALRVDPALDGRVAGWLRWQARHVAAAGDNRGVVPDHWVRAGDLAESTCPPGLAAALCEHVDAADSTAASLLVLADTYRRHAAGVQVLQEPEVLAALEAAAATLQRLTQPGGLTWAKPSHRVVYLMDAVEVAAGWRAWSRLQQEVFMQPLAARTSAARALRAEAAIGERLWDAGAGQWRVSLGATKAQPARWYPDTVAQAWPLLWGGAELERSRGAWQTAARRWQGSEHWARSNVDPDGFWWPAVAVAAHCVGDGDAARTWAGRARQRWLDPADPFAWPFQIADLLWLLALAEPVPARTSSFVPFPSNNPSQ